jgi:hypothetical protein
LTEIPAIVVPAVIIDLVATGWAAVRTYDQYQSGEISGREALTLEITGIAGVIPGPIRVAFSFINAMETGTAAIK